MRILDAGQIEYKYFTVYAIYVRIKSIVYHNHHSSSRDARSITIESSSLIHTKSRSEKKRENKLISSTHYDTINTEEGISKFKHIAPQCAPSCE